MTLIQPPFVFTPAVCTTSLQRKDDTQWLTDGGLSSDDCVFPLCMLYSSFIKDAVQRTQKCRVLIKVLTPESRILVAGENHVNQPRVFLISRISLLGSGVPVGHGGADQQPKRSSTGGLHRSGSDAHKIPDNTAPGQK